MNRPECLVPVTYLRIAMRDLDPGAEWTAGLFAALGIAPSGRGASGQMATLAQVRSALRKLASRNASPGWHLALAAHLSITSHGPLGVAAATARDLGAAVDVLMNYSGVRAPFVWLSAGRNDGGGYSIRIHEARALGEERETLIEIALLCLQSIIGAVLGFAPHGLQVDLAYAAPVYEKDLRAAVRGRLRFGASTHRLQFPAALLDTPCALHDEPLHRSALARCREILHETTGESDIEVALRRALLQSSGRLPGLRQIAAGLRMSPRTLVRRLEKSGNAYRRIREDVLRGQAADLLLHSESSVAEIAAQLGYSDPSNFTRAFRRWYGVAPRRFRSAS